MAMAEFASPRTVHLGPMQFVYDRGEIRYVRLNGVEVLRRIYVGVRDTAWGTIAGAMEGEECDVAGEQFTAHYRSVHRAEPVDFTWTAQILARCECRNHVVEAEVRFVMRGAANRAYRTNRTGLCVLHPVRQCAGRVCEIEHPDGRRSSGSFPSLIAAHQPFTDIRAMRYEPVAGLAVELRFDGDAFETEDQRNWTDSSYKTYCRPLSRPFPYVLKHGERVEQAITLRIRQALGPAGRGLPENRIAVKSTLIGPLRAVGVSMGDVRRGFSSLELQRMKGLRLAHVRVDVALGRESEPELRDRIGIAKSLGVPIELALHLSGETDAQVRPLAPLMRSVAPQVVRWFVLRNREKVTPLDDIAAVEKALGLAGVRIGGGTIGNFSELNRHREIVQRMETVNWPITPQVHAMDDLSLFENLEAQGDTVRCVRAFAPGTVVCAGPVVLHRQPDPFAAGKSGELEPAVPDSRHGSLLGSAWTLGALKSVAEASPDAMTFFQAIGSLGVMDAGRVMPLYHVLAEAGRCAGQSLVSTESSDPLRFDALAVRGTSGLRILIASYRPEPVAMTLEGVPAGGSMRRVHASTERLAMEEPEAFVASAEPAKGVIELDGYGVAMIDVPI